LPLYQSTLGLATGAEALAPTVSGTDAQKLSQLVASLLPEAQAWAKANNIDWPEAEIQKWASAVVDMVNLIPAPAAGLSYLPLGRQASGVLYAFQVRAHCASVLAVYSDSRNSIARIFRAKAPTPLPWNKSEPVAK
jgi:hypothetical protein